MSSGPSFENIALAGNLHAVALEAAYIRLHRAGDRIRGFEPDESSRVRELARTFSLSPLELDLLLFAAAPELVPAIPAAFREEPRTVAAAYEFLQRDCDWLTFRNALRDDAPLRYWRMLSLDDSDEALPSRTLSADPRIVDYLLGCELASERVCRVARWRSAADASQLSSEAARVVAAGVRAIELFSRSALGRRIFFGLPGGSNLEAEEFAQGVLASMSMPLLTVEANISSYDRILVLRESLLARAGLLVHDIAGAADREEWFVRLGQASPVVFLTGFESRPAALAEQAWVDVTLPVTSRPMNHRLGELAQRIPPSAAWNDLILPVEVKARLEELCTQARLQHTVLVDGGFARKLARGRSVTGLFCGPSGTGKTLAAEVIAHHLQRDLYRVDLARVVSKYIGDTERNLRQVFAESERARCVLFFDEADALFGKRTEVRDSHDRYANLEVSYLLQLFEEAEQSVVLLSSNRRQAIDDAFARRFRFVVDFPMPSATLREELWRTSFSDAISLDSSIRLDVLAERLPLSGASIRNIALASAFFAVAENGGTPATVSAAHLFNATRREFEKLASPMPITFAELTAVRKGTAR
jgi:hypothetical protein